jgi:hypothetical protein
MPAGNDRLGHVLFYQMAANFAAVTLEGAMLWIIAAILVVLWLLGFFAFHIAGGLIHLLLVVAVVVVVYNLFTGRRKL